MPKKDLLKFYGYFDGRMPGRSQGRTKHDVELFMFATFIVHAIDDGLWNYPIEVIYDDRPDFIIKSSKGIIGVEVTEQRSKNYGQALAMLQDSDGFMEPSDFINPAIY